MDRAVLESHRSFPVFAALDGKKKNLLERFLCLFADVRAGEGAGALLLATNAFALLSAYYLLKTIREALILSQWSPEGKIYTSAAQALLLLLVAPAYGAFASRVIRIRLITWVSLFFATHLAVFSALGEAGLRVGVAFYVWLGIFNLLFVGQFWAFANDLYDEEKGKRLFPLLGVGTALGGFVGARLAAVLFRSLGPYRLMLLSAAILIVSLLFTTLVNHRESAVEGSRQQRLSRELIGREGGFALLRSNRYLFLIALLVLLLNLVNTTGEFIMSKLVTEAQSATGDAASRMQFFGEFAGRFYSLQNLLVLFLQMFLVSRIFRYLGVRAALFILPLIAFGGYALAFLFPVLGAVRIVKVLENSTDYSIQNTARQALFLPTSREAKYKAKITIDTFVTRFGDVLGAVLVLIGSALLSGVRQYAALNVVFVVGWLFVVAAVAREHNRLVPSAPAHAG